MYSDKEVCHDNLYVVLSEDNSIDMYKKIPTELHLVKGSFYVMIDGKEYNIHKSLKKGGIPIFRCSSNIDHITFDLDQKFDEVYHKIRRNYNDFGVDIKVEKNSYKQCEGGGWYCKVDTYHYKNKIYYWL